MFVGFHSGSVVSNVIGSSDPSILVYWVGDDEIAFATSRRAGDRRRPTSRRIRQRQRRQEMFAFSTKGRRRATVEMVDEHLWRQEFQTQLMKRLDSSNGQEEKEKKDVIMEKQICLLVALSRVPKERAIIPNNE